MFWGLLGQEGRSGKYKDSWLVWFKNNEIALAGVAQWIERCKPGGQWFDSKSGHMPGLWTRSPVGGT